MMTPKRTAAATQTGNDSQKPKWMSNCAEFSSA